jgi:hypothetical protein
MPRVNRLVNPLPKIYGVGPIVAMTIISHLVHRRSVPDRALFRTHHAIVQIRGDTKSRCSIPGSGDENQP